MQHVTRDIDYGRGAAIALSVVIPTRDRADSVIRAVQSVLGGENPLVEVVVADDGSKDDTRQRLLALQDPRLQVVGVATSRGANHARNLGAKAARAPLIAFLDSDDTFRPERVARLIAAFAARPEMDASIDGYLDHGARGAVEHRLPALVPDPEAFRHMLIAHQIPLTNSTLTVRKAAFEAVGGFDETLRRHQDRELLVRLSRSHVVAMGGAVDVDKYRGTASISHNFEGYIEGLEAFMARTPEAKQPEYADLVHYLSVRSILKALLQGQFRAALRERRKLSDSGLLPRSLLKSALRYRAGRRHREHVNFAGRPRSGN
jgi:glycosyltransferase involved in cell wall biosynthesis